MGVPTVLGLGSLKGSVQKPDRTHTASSSPSTTGPGSTNSQALASSPATSVTNGQINNNNKYKLTNSSKSEIVPQIVRNTTPTLTNNGSPNNTTTTREQQNYNNKIITTTTG